MNRTYLGNIIFAIWCVGVWSILAIMTIFDIKVVQQIGAFIIFVVLSVVIKYLIQKFVVNVKSIAQIIKFKGGLTYGSSKDIEMGAKDQN